MDAIVTINSSDALQEFQDTRALPPLLPDQFNHDAPNVHLKLIAEEGEVLAQASLWWENTPAYKNYRLGLIGHYGATSEHAASTMLEHACGELSNQGCNFVVGPMNGSTWRSYRFVTQRGDAPPFFLEPDNPEEYPLHYLNHGFVSIAEYTSSVNNNLNQVNPRLERMEENIRKEGIVIRPLCKEKFREELAAIYEVSVKSFTRNFLYTPVSKESFIEQYLPLEALVQPELVHLAEQQGRLVGFVFAIPDRAQAERGEVIDTMLVKTLSVLPELQSVGLGGLLLHHCHQNGHKLLGYTKAIHALMYNDNVSKKMSHRFATTIRKYTLYGKELTP